MLSKNATIEGFVWNKRWLIPQGEHERVIQRRFRALDQIEKIVSHCKEKKVCVQAGGHFGFWPRHLCKMFEYVYTFEPEPRNFTALTVNTSGMKNITRIQSALGCEHKPVDLFVYPNKINASYVKGPGPIPSIKIDDLGLPICSLICLDIEGAELNALMGASETLDRCRPVVSFESKGLAQRNDQGGEDPQKWLESKGYHKIDTAGKDVVMSC